MAGYWARKRGVTNTKFKADWETFGKAAGPIRNQEMLVLSMPELVVAFPGGRGTEDMIKRSKKAGVEVISLYKRMSFYE